MNKGQAQAGVQKTEVAKPRKRPLTAKQKEEALKKEALLAEQDSKGEVEVNEQKHEDTGEVVGTEQPVVVAETEQPEVVEPETVESSVAVETEQPVVVIEKEESDVEGQSELSDDGIVTNPNLKDTANKVEEPEFVRLTKIEKSQRNVSIKSLHKEWVKDQTLKTKRKAEIAEAIKNGTPIPEGDDGTTLRFDLAIQRNETWTDLQKSELIHSILYGYYVPPVLVQDSNDGKKWFLDGKQRITTLMTFLSGEWQLSKKTKPVYGHKIGGLKFGDLTTKMKEEIHDETITFILMKGMTDVERDELFVRQNSGSPLSRIEMTRAMHSELIESINEIANLKFFKEDIELSRKARVGFVDQEIILQIAMLLEEGKDKIKGFGAGNIEEYVLRLKEAEKTISDELFKRFEDVATYLTLAFDDYEMGEIKKVLKKIHIPIIFWNAETAMKENLQPKLYGDFIRSFLISGYTVESKYGVSCQSGSSKKENVLIRLDEMSKSLAEFFEMIKSSSNIEEGVAEFDKYLADKNGIARQIDSSDIEASEE